ncbi:hypothetical protein ACFL1H_03105 [Nanoarchaeota archaeon]
MNEEIKKDLRNVYKGLENILNPDEYAQKEDELLKKASKKIISDSLEGGRTWERDITAINKNKYTANVVVESWNNENVSIQAVIIFEYIGGYRGSLYLGDEDGPLISQTHIDTGFYKLAKEYFSINRNC